MAQTRKASARTPKAKPAPKPRGAPKAETDETAPPLPANAVQRRATPFKSEPGTGAEGASTVDTAARYAAAQRLSAADLPTETSQEALTGIAQDAVLILRRGLSYRAELALEDPGSVSMGDCIALLRLTTEIGAEARKGEDGLTQTADYSRLAPAERVQLAALLLKVDYA